jgi:hypothetical protein
LTPDETLPDEYGDALDPFGDKALVADLSARLAECERERDEAQQAADNSYELYREAWDKNAALLAENRVLLGHLGRLYDTSIIAPLTAAEVERVKGLEQANQELREQLDCSVYRSDLTRRAHTHSAALSPEVKK